MWLLLGCRPEPSPPPVAPPAGHSGASTADTGVASHHTGPDDVVHSAVPGEELVAEPPPGAYETLSTVTLSGVGGPVVYTLDGSVPEFGVSPEATGPIPLGGSTLLRARGLTSDGEEVHLAGAWLRLEPGLVGFDGELPVLIAWSEAPVPEYRDDRSVPYTLTVFEPGAGGRTVLPAEADNSGRAGLRVRGSSSAGYSKHPYRLETWDDLDDGDRVTPLVGMPANGDWNLLAPAAFDRALMRNSLAFALSNAIGRYAPRTRFVELFVAGAGEDVGVDDYVGVYELVERIEVDPDRVAVTPMAPTDVAEPEVTGGWLFKEDRLGPGESGFYAGAGLQFQQPFAYESPKEQELAPEQAAWLTAHLDELGVALTSPGFVHPVTGRAYGDLLDPDSFVDHHLVNVYTKNPDAFRLSGYFHQERGGRLQAGPVWDFDRTMGCSDDWRAEDPTGWDASDVTSDTTYVFDHGFYGGLFDDPAFRDRWATRLEDLLAAELSVASVHATIDAMAAELDEASVRNAARWPEYAPRGSWEAEVQLLRTWTEVRHDWMVGCLAEPDPIRCR
jgi:hypothetical protein